MLMILFMRADARELFFPKALLNSFAKSTGLMVNYGKSMMVPVNVDEAKLEILSRTLGCAKGSLPFTYLGLPLSLTRPTVADYWPLVSRCERRLVSVPNYLSEAVRLQLTNAVFSALPTFAMSTYLLPKTVIKQIDKFRKHCLWRGSDANNKKPPKAAWPLVCVPKECGGLGVLDLHTHNQSLLLKNLHKFFNRLDIPWVSLVWASRYSNDRLPNATRKGSFWWRDIQKLIPVFKAMAVATISSGSSTFFGLTIGLASLSVLICLSFSCLLKINSSQCSVSINLQSPMFSFIYLSLKRPISSSLICQLSCRM